MYCCFGIRDLLNRQISDTGKELLETQKVNWLDLTDSQKEKVLAQTKAYLRQQVMDAKISKHVMAVLDKHDII